MSLTRFGVDPWDLTTFDPATRRYGEGALIDPYSYGAESRLMPAIQRTRTAIREFAPLLAADIVEGDNDFHVHVDLPGVAPEDLDINIANGFVHLKAERKQVHEETLGWTHNIERSYGRISRSIQLPPRADVDNSTASFQNGVLSIVFRKLEGPAIGKKLMIN